jgi:glycosyltransferase involved in cell wall biosynthesis
MVVRVNQRVPVTLVIPCYNEEAAIPNLSKRLSELGRQLESSHELRLLFVDDGSTDQTAALLAKAYGAEAVIRHGENRGIAAAIMTGLQEASTELVCTIDSDCTYDPLQLPMLLAEMVPGVDLVTASPYHPDGAVHNVPAWRLILSKGLSVLYRLTLHHSLSTYTSCFRVHRRAAFEGIQIGDERFPGIAEMLAILDMRGGRIVEVAATLERRIHGESKMKTARTIVGHLRLLARLWRTKLAGQGIHQVKESNG